MAGVKQALVQNIFATVKEVYGVVVCTPNGIPICIYFSSNELPSIIAIPYSQKNWSVYIIVIHLRHWDLKVQSSINNGILIVLSLDFQTTLSIYVIFFIHLIQGHILKIDILKFV